MRREFSAGGVMLRRMRGRWWVAVARPQGRPPGFWVLPKGLIDPGEASAETAVRETYEETGVRGRPIAKLGNARYVYTWDGERVLKVVSFYLLRSTGGRIGTLPAGMEREITEARWVPLDDAPALLRHLSEREIAEAALAAARDL